MYGEELVVAVMVERVYEHTKIHLTSWFEVQISGFRVWPVGGYDLGEMMCGDVHKLLLPSSRKHLGSRSYQLMQRMTNNNEFQADVWNIVLDVKHQLCISWFTINVVSKNRNEAYSLRDW